MMAAGVEFLGEPRAEPYGRVVVFRDVAGNRWDLLGTPPLPPDSRAVPDHDVRQSWQRRPGTIRKQPRANWG
jgi:hypothetical protein